MSSSGPTIRNENYGLSPVPLQGHHDDDKLDINFEFLLIKGSNEILGCELSVDAPLKMNRLDELVLECD